MGKPMRAASIALLTALPLLASCDAPATTPMATSRGVQGPIVSACRAEVARKVGVSVAEVRPVDVIRTPSGTEVRALAPGRKAPWACSANRDGVILSVLYTGWS
ncbi:hypothetical protein [Amaricoccus solimangrovi]|uniref:Uncharacterized protein n=1 Tax=Amaricoccus solimangrovi TaxID=2589815 RepID=A0A501WYX5_9RHOB|nr:hypothetical protein [Amaricoccus solimangrovi]TPE53514.1 hypothetical protein FJM51_00225 [Amaricoccus solimangrovi]